MTDLWKWLDDEESSPFEPREPEPRDDVDDLDFYDRVFDQTAAVDW